MNTSMFVSNIGSWLGSRVSSILDSITKIYRSDTIPTPGYTSVALSAEISNDLNGQGGETVAGYFVANGNGNIGTGPVNDLVGVSATAVKNTNCWSAAIHADVYDTVPGGTAIGVNIEIPITQKETDTIGVNIQPFKGTQNVVGIQLQHPETYKHGIVAPNTNFVFGVVDGVSFGMRFNPKTQCLEFFRNIGEPNEIRKGFIDMSFEQKDVQINK